MRKPKRWIRILEKNTEILIPVMLIFPIIVGLFYALPLPRIIDIDSGDLLAYYGTVFGIMGSFFLYRSERKKEQMERQHEVKPIFTVQVKTSEEFTDAFEIQIRKKSEKNFSYFYLYDEFVSEVVQNETLLRVSYNLTSQEVEKRGIDYNITVEDGILDEDGYPKYIQLLCDDVDGNCWNCCFHKVKDLGNIYYYPDPFEIV